LYLSKEINKDENVIEVLVISYLSMLCKNRLLMQKSCCL